MLQFDQESHIYTVNKRKIPSVTQVIREVLKSEKEIEQTSQMFKGQVIHKTLELNDKNDLLEYDKRIAPYITAWNKFKHDFKIEKMDCELKVFSEKLQLAGTIDRVASSCDELYLIDIKTGKSYKEYPLQTAAYEILLRHDKIRLATKRMCVYLSEVGYTVEEHNNPQDEEVFLSLLKVWQWKKNKLKSV